MIARARETQAFWPDELAALDAPENRAAWMCGSVEDWATETLLAARAAYLIPGTDRRLKPSQKLGEDYMKANLPVARQRLYQTGIRLATVLNEALSSDYWIIAEYGAVDLP